jgi:hypothetical protein
MLSLPAGRQGLILSGAYYPDLKIGVWRRRTYQSDAPYTSRPGGPILKRSMGSPLTSIPIGQIEQRILLIRGQRVMLDADLAMLYGVPTRVLNQAVRRNAKRFPQDFMFKLTQSEKNEVITICDHLKNLKYAKALPNAFTEHGAIMVASVLNTQRAMQVSVFVVRAFVKLREMEWVFLFSLKRPARRSPVYWTQAGALLKWNAPRITLEA